MSLGAEELRHLRTAVAEWSVRELAKAATVPVWKIQYVEEGRGRFHPEQETQIYEAIDARVRKLSGV